MAFKYSQAVFEHIPHTKFTFCEKVLPGGAMADVFAASHIVPAVIVNV